MSCCGDFRAMGVGSVMPDMGVLACDCRMMVLVIYALGRWVTLTLESSTLYRPHTQIPNSRS